VGAKRQPARTSSARLAKQDDSRVRLNKFLADCGVASRRGCDELIEKGKVTVDGMPVTTLGIRVDPTQQAVEVEGYVLRPEHAARCYYLLNKPSGVVCTNEKRETRPRAIDLVTDKAKGRIYTVGRLDEDSTGLILLTNDGEFAQQIAHPRFGVPKTYKVKLQGRISDGDVQKVREGIHLSEGRTSGARILVTRRSPKASALMVTLLEGKNREVRRVFARVGHKVVSLERTDIGPLNLRGLKSGKWRSLSREEVEALLTMAAGETPEAEPQEEKARAEKSPAKRAKAKSPAQSAKAQSAKAQSAKAQSAKAKPAAEKPAAAKPTPKRKPAARKKAAPKKDPVARKKPGSRTPGKKRATDKGKPVGRKRPGAKAKVGGKKQAARKPARRSAPKTVETQPVRRRRTVEPKD
jgi:23S rRNA pseudouridine2605 synthase